MLAGRPNSGKSSLLNRLAGYDAAIVTPVPGTTRDVLRERIDIDGLPLHVLDTAGLRDSEDAVEREGVRRAAAEMTRADRVLFVVDSAADPLGRAFEEERAPRGPASPRWYSTEIDSLGLRSGHHLGTPRLRVGTDRHGPSPLRAHLKSASASDGPG